MTQAQIAALVKREDGGPLVVQLEAFGAVARLEFDPDDDHQYEGAEIITENFAVAIETALQAAANGIGEAQDD